MMETTTRRAVVATAAALPVLATATALKDEQTVPHLTARHYIEMIALMHRDGRRAALNAYRADADWTRLKRIDLESPNAPVLHFGSRPGAQGYPKAEIMASASGVWLHGPVESF